MSYQTILVNKQFYENENFGEMLENENRLPKIPEERRQKMEAKLERYKYNITKKNSEEAFFIWQNNDTGVQARVSNYVVEFQSGRDENGIFEIMQTTSEFVDDFFAKFDVQTGIWEKE